MRITLRKLLHALALLAAGGAAYYAAPVALRLWRAPAPPPIAPIATIGVPEGPIDRAGDAAVVNCLAALERRRSIEVEMMQSGTVLNQPIKVAGIYRQKGRGASRRFATLLQGQLGGAQVKLWQVSDSRFLHTDVSWEPQPPAAASSPTDRPRRKVTRIDLLSVRAELAARQGDDAPLLGVGQATAASIDPLLSSALGGLPMLIESLGANFHFGAPRRMQMHNQPVFVMIGHWQPASYATLAAAANESNTKPDAAAAKPDAATTARLPHHVLLVLSAQDLFPLLIEYRAADDPLSAPGLSDDTRLQQNLNPLLRLEFHRPRFDVELAEAEFQYPEAGDVDRRDITAARIATLRKRHKLRVAAHHAGTLVR